MSNLKSSHASTNALIGIWNVLLTAFIVATLYFGRHLLVPLALAALLTFLLAPLVTRLQRFLGRLGSVLLTVALILATAGLAGWVLTSQLGDLAAKLPDYQENIRTKLRSFKLPSGGRLTKISEMVEELKKDLPGAKPPDVAQPPVSVETEVATERRSQPAATIPVVAPRAPAVTASNSNPFELIRVILAPVLGPLGQALLVLLLVVFMLLKREDLRSRLIRLIGQGRIGATTRAMDDAGGRVTRYLTMQLIINLGYGVCVAIGLYFIGVPNAVLWGALATVLRFIPYAGPWLAAVLPITLSLAISPGWTTPLLTVGLFTLLELISNNVVEPWLYGSSTGVSPVALILAAVVWAWLWGPIGLVLATPLTVCLVVMGRHIPRLAFLSVLLSDQEALTPAEDCYYRLLTVGAEDEMELVESYLKGNSLAALYDGVLIPVLTAVELDHRQQLLDDAQRALLEQNLRDIVEDLVSRPLLPPGTGPAPSGRVYCLPARAERDELAGTMLAHLLYRQGFEAQCAPSKMAADEVLALVGKSGADAVCISVVTPSTVLHARFLCLKLRALLPGQRIVVGLWGATENLTDAIRRVRDSGADEVVTTLADAVAYLARLAPPAPVALIPSGEKGA